MSRSGGQGSDKDGRNLPLAAQGEGPDTDPFNEIFENAPVGIYQVTPAGRYLRANPSMARILGYESPAALIAAIDDDLKIEVLRKDQQRIWIRDSFRTVRDSEGKAIYFEGFVEEIAQQDETESALRETQAWITALAENSAAAVAVKDRNGRYLFANKRFQDMNGLKLNHDRRTLKKILENAVPQTLQDVVIIYAAVTGNQDGQFREENYVNKVYPQVVAGRLWSAIQVTTAAGICSVMDIVLAHPEKYHGFVAQEQFELSDILDNRFGRFYAHGGTYQTSAELVARGETGHQMRRIPHRSDALPFAFQFVHPASGLPLLAGVLE